MTNYVLTREQYKVLSGLAYWRAELAAAVEYDPTDTEDIKHCKESVSELITECDALEIPFFVQNIILCWAENWRAYYNQYDTDILRKHGITVKSIFA